MGFEAAGVQDRHCRAPMSLELSIQKTGLDFRAISILLCSDLFSLALALILTISVLGAPNDFARALLLTAAISFGLGLTQFNLYPGRGKLGPERIRARALLAAIAFGSPAIVGAVLLSNDLGSGSLECLITGFLLFAFSSFFELVAIHAADALGIWRVRANFVGDAELFKQTKKDLDIFPELGLALTYAHDHEAECRVAVIHGSGNAFQPDGFVTVTVGDHLPNFYPVLGRRKARRNVANESVARIIKRGIDIAAAVVGLVFISPAILIVGICIYIADGRPIFFRQLRVGADGKMFQVWKLRSMYRDAGARLEELLANDPIAKEEWGRHFKLHDDPRVLPGVGNFIRRSSVDEFPQIWNILLGDMSFIGPRPFPENHMNMFSSEFRSLRQSVPPGLSGLWQVTVRSNGDLGDQERLDRAYVSEWSLWLDIYIFLRTPIALFFATGAR